MSDRLETRIDVVQRGEYRCLVAKTEFVPPMKVAATRENMAALMELFPHASWTEGARGWWAAEGGKHV